MILKVIMAHSSLVPRLSPHKQWKAGHGLGMRVHCRTIKQQCIFSKKVSSVNNYGCKNYLFHSIHSTKYLYFSVYNPHTQGSYLPRAWVQGYTYVQNRISAN